MGIFLAIIAIIVVLGWVNAYGSGSTQDYFNEQRRYDFERDFRRDVERNRERAMDKWQQEQDEYMRKFREDNWRR